MNPSALAAVLALAAVGGFVVWRSWPTAVAACVAAFALSWSWSDPVALLGTLLFWGFVTAVIAEFTWAAWRSELARAWFVAGSAFLLALALSTLWSVDPGLTVREGAKFAGVVLVASSVGAHVHEVTGAERRLTAALGWLAPAAILGSAAVAAVGAVDDDRVQGGGASGVFNGPNTLGIFLALTVPFTLASPAFAHRWWVRAGVLAAAVFTATLSGGRAGMLALAIAVAAVAFGTGGIARLARDLAPCAAAFGLALLWAPQVPALDEPTALSGRQAPASTGEKLLGGARVHDQSRVSVFLGARDEAWRESLRLTRERPHGHGFGTGSTLFDRYRSRARFEYFVGEFVRGTNPHNSYLQAFLEVGVLGGLLFLGPLAAAVAVAIRFVLAAGHVAAVPYCASVLGAAAAAIFESILTQAGALTLLSWVALSAVLAMAIRARGAGAGRH